MRSVRMLRRIAGVGSRRTQVRQIAAIGALAIVLAACGGSGSSNGSDEPTSGADATGNGGPDAEILATALDSIDTARVGGWVALRGASELFNPPGGGVVDVSSGESETYLRLDIDGEPRTWRVTGDVTYLQPGNSGPGSEDEFDLAWVRLDPTEVSAEDGYLVSVMAVSPSVAYLNALRIATDVAKSGPPEEIDGNKYTPYSACIPIAAALDDSVDSAGNELDGNSLRELELLHWALGDESPLVVWLDEAGRPVRLEFTALIEAGAEGVLELSDFGVDVDVLEPPADEIVPIDDYIDRTRGSSIAAEDEEPYSLDRFAERFGEDAMLECPADGEPIRSDLSDSRRASTTTEPFDAGNHPESPPTNHDPNVGY